MDASPSSDRPMALRASVWRMLTGVTATPLATGASVRRSSTRSVTRALLAGAPVAGELVTGASLMR